MGRSRRGILDEANPYIVFADVLLCTLIIVIVLFYSKDLLLGDSSQPRGAKPAFASRTVSSKECAFDSGRAIPRDTTQIKKIIDEVVANVKRGATRVRIEGHTDNVPINSSQFPSNWELSSARAIWLAKQIEDRIVAAGMKVGPEGVTVEAIGYGDQRPRADNSSAAGRQANRRLEIVYETSSR